MSNLVAVYGTLRQGQGNNYLLGGLTPISTCILSGYEMYTAGSFPVVFKGDGDITVELYHVVFEETMRRLDALEGHPNWYLRELVDTPEGKAWMYIMLDDGYKSNAKIESGDWVDC